MIGQHPNRQILMAILVVRQANTENERSVSHCTFRKEAGDNPIALASILRIPVAFKSFM